MKSLSGKIALVTGASCGIGKGIAIGLAAAVAQEYGFTDIDGKQPSPLTVQET